MAKKQEASVDELVGMIKRGELVLPEMQRGYVWKSGQVCNLLDSLYRSYPSGAILIWEMEGKGDSIPSRDMAIEQKRSAYKPRLLLDGQQRLTSLSAVIRDTEVNVRDKNKPINILFNLEHPSKESPSSRQVDEENDDIESEQAGMPESDKEKRLAEKTFAVSSLSLKNDKRWVRVSDVFKNNNNTEFLKRAGITSFDDPLHDRYNERLNKLRDVKKYEYHLDVLERTLSYEEVTDIFVRVNSLGMKLRRSDLALAQISAKWRGSLPTFEKFQGECKDKGFDFELGIHLRNMVVMATGQATFKTAGALDKATLKTAWDDACKGMSFAINFLKNNVEMRSRVSLVSPFVVIVVSYFAHKQGYKILPSDSSLLRSWVLLANAKRRYSLGSTETLLDQDIRSIRNGGTIQDLLDHLRSQVTRLEIFPEDLSGSNTNGGLFKTMFLAFSSVRAKDWDSSLELDPDHMGQQNRLNEHHIFPVALLKKAIRKKLIVDVEKQDIHDIANLAFISAKTNGFIKDKSPEEYLPIFLDKKKVGEEVFSAQEIPLDLELRKVSAYKDFLKARRERIAKRLNEFIGL